MDSASRTCGHNGTLPVGISLHQALSSRGLWEWVGGETKKHKDALVCQLYALTEEEIKVVEGAK